MSEKRIALPENQLAPKTFSYLHLEADLPTAMDGTEAKSIHCKNQWFCRTSAQWSEILVPDRDRVWTLKGTP